MLMRLVAFCPNEFRIDPLLTFIRISQESFDRKAVSGETITALDDSIDVL